MLANLLLDVSEKMRILEVKLCLFWRAIHKNGRFEEKKIVVASATILCILVEKRQRRRKEEKRVWTRPWIFMREQHGAYHCLLQELRLWDKPSYTNFLRMDEAAFEELLQKVGPLITKQDTHMRASIPAAERLALTLRGLNPTVPCIR
jgi:hypothetical protein